MIQETELAAAAADRKPAPTDAELLRDMLARANIVFVAAAAGLEVRGSTQDYVPVLTPCYIRFTFDAAGQLTGLAFGY